jgi:DNA-binding response OmpR family regulator
MSHRTDNRGHNYEGCEAVLDQSNSRMNVLIVESQANLGNLWKAHLLRSGADVRLATTQEAACAYIVDQSPDVIILDLVLSEGSALAVSDYASYKAPNARIIFVTDTSFFSDGSIFNLASNACAFIQSTTPPEDVAAMVEHYAANDRLRS